LVVLDTERPSPPCALIAVAESGKLVSVVKVCSNLPAETVMSLAMMYSLVSMSAWSSVSIHSVVLPVVVKPFPVAVTDLPRAPEVAESVNSLTTVIALVPVVTVAVLQSVPWFLESHISLIDAAVGSVIPAEVANVTV